MYKTGIISGFFCSNRKQHRQYLLCTQVKIYIVAQHLSILQILAGGDPLAWFATIMSTLVMVVLVAVILIFRRKDE